VLRFKEFNELCDQLAELADGMRRDADPRSGHLPFCIQAFQTPRDDLRYITTYIAAGNEVCDTLFSQLTSQPTHTEAACAVLTPPKGDVRSTDALGCGNCILSH
jgi:hypothetical protein